jgi:hypothetical protein
VLGTQGRKQLPLLARPREEFEGVKLQGASQLGRPVMEVEGV